MVMTVVSLLALGTVVCLHLPSLPRHWMLDWAVPWFFFASGFWYARSAKPYGEQVRARVKSLLVPYCLWNLAWFPILFAANWLGTRYCGASRVVDGSAACVFRCLGLNPCAWPALVPTWFLRALFAVVVVVGGVERLLAFGVRRAAAVRLVVCGFFWGVYMTCDLWMPAGEAWRGFFSFGLPHFGCAWFATGLALAEVTRGHGQAPSAPWIRAARRQMMPVYLLHAPVIVTLGWGAKALHRFDLLTTAIGDAVMWVVGVGGAVVLGEALRRAAPRLAVVLFGGR